MDYEGSDIVAANKRLNNPRTKQFPTSPVHKKQRSHSRGNSITNFDQILNHPSSIPSPPLSRSSSHRRRSSVSTKRESAELMGASLPEDGLVTIDGSKVDDHLRALFALEGRSSNSPSPLAPSFGFTKVELPDFGAEMEKKPDLTASPSKPSFNANNSLTGKRDSFGKLHTPAFNAKKELQTLLEEDEGDDFTSDPGSVPAPAPRHRPRSLNLRSSLIRLSASLPTPSPTPSVRTPKLKSLTLASSTVVTSSPPRNDNHPKRSSTLVISNSAPLLSTAEVQHVHRRSSISYRRTSTSEAALSLPTTNTNSQTLTPSPSPTFEKHRRSLSPTELLAQSAYFTQSHASFLARIAELEAALAQSTATPSPAPTEPSEELLEMLADLKAERDLLKRSLDELIARYNDQEKQINALGRRLDNEKRDGWVHKEKLGRAEAEKRTVEKENEDLNEQLASMRLQLQTAHAQVHVEKEARLKTEGELYAALDSQKATAAPYPYPTTYRRIQESIDSELNHQGGRRNFEAQPAQVEEHLVQEEEDSDTSFHSRSVSSVSYDSGLLSRHPSSVNTPDDSQTRDLASGWSFAKASRRVKPKASIDNFFSCLEDSDDAVPVESVGLPSLKSDSSPGGFSIGFGLSPDEDEDSTFNFGQPASPSPFQRSDEDSSFSFVQPASPYPFPRSDESDEEIPVGPVEPTPFIDDEDAAFSFATPDEFYPAPTPSLAQVVFTANNSSNSNNTTHASPPPSIPKFVDPTTPRPRHKAKDSMHLRRRSRNDRQSVDLSGSFSPFLPEAGPLPRSAPSSNGSFTFPRSSTAPARSQTTPQPSLLDIAIPSGSIGSSLPLFDLDALSPPPPRKSTQVQARVPRGPSSDEGSSRRARVYPPVFVPSPPPQSAARSDDTHTRVRISRSAESRRRGQQLSQQQEPPTPPPSTPSKSPMTSLSFASLANLFPSSWTSPHSSVSASSPTSSMGRDSFDRSYVSRERQLNRLRSEVERSRSLSHDHTQSRTGAIAL